MTPNNHDHLRAIVTNLLEQPKGIFAIDESIESCNKRFALLGIPETVEKRRDYRELLVTVPEIEQYVSGYIMHDETIRQSTTDGWRFADVLHDKGIHIGIKVDTGLMPFADSSIEQITNGLDGLGDRLIEYRDVFGASFTKWRALIHIGENIPTDACLLENANRLAQYAKIVQEHDMVPIIEPEVLMTGNHTIQQCYDVTARNLKILMTTLHEHDVYLGGVILKTSMVIDGSECSVQSDIDTVAHMTMKCLQEYVSPDIGGIVFLSGGQDTNESAQHLNRMSQLYPNLSWELTFSYGRGIQDSALHHFAKYPEDRAGIQDLVMVWARADSLASIGKLPE